MMGLVEDGIDLVTKPLEDKIDELSNLISECIKEFEAINWKGVTSELKMELLNQQRSAKRDAPKELGK